MMTELAFLGELTLLMKYFICYLSVTALNCRYRLCLLTLYLPLSLYAVKEIKTSFSFSFLSSGAIKRKVELDWGTEDMEYLQKVELHSEGALNEVKPDIIIYNAGTDILDGDALGGLAISPQVLSFILPFSPPYQILDALLVFGRVF